MKKILLTTLIIALSFVSCDTVGHDPENYMVEITVIDTNNNDLVKGLKCLQDKNHKDDGYCTISQQEFQCYNITENTYNYNPEINTTKEPQTLVLHLSAEPKAYPNEIKLEMSCHHIFKDFKKHEMTVKMEYYSKYSGGCKSIIFEGKEYNVTYNKERYSYHAEVTLER